MKRRILNIACIGAGYVGGPTMAVIADRGPDIAKAQRLLGGWEPKVQLAEGLARTLAYFRKQP